VIACEAPFREPVESAAMKPSPERFAQVLSRLRERVEGRYGIPVRVVDVPPPFTGDLDGAEIHLDCEQKDELQVFTLAHLFGHTVQWSLSSRAREIGGKPPGQYSAEDLAEVDAYEAEASRFGLALLHEAGVDDLDAWLSDFSACDRAYLEHFYKTGEKRPTEEFWRDGRPLLAPLSIPAFTPHRATFRWEGVVI